MKVTPERREQVGILVPIYKPQFEPLEQFSIDFSLAVAANRDCFFVAPEGMNCNYYEKRYPGVRLAYFSPDFFDSIDSYSRLLLSTGFYSRFEAYEFVLILQPDAILFQDNLDYWAEQAFDYIGAPWPDGLELTVWRDRFGGGRAKRVRAKVGNGGLSLRRVTKCLSLLAEFPETHAAFVHATANEDSYFSIMGLVSEDFSIPSEVIASRFSMELRPEYYYSINGLQYPMGAHAWWIVQPKFWAPCLPPLASVL
jgi:hypothetical protein